MRKRKVRFQFVITPRGVIGISTFHVHDLEIDFLIDGSEESEMKIKERLWEIFYTQYSSGMSDSNKFPATGFEIIGWSFLESKADLPLTMDDVMRETKRTYSPLEQKSGGQGPQ